jgi:lipid-A-disaccharide synthase
MKYYIIAGEASGDLHASNLMIALKKLDEKAEFRIWGGDLMKAEGGDLVMHYSDLAFMGFVEVLKNLSTIFDNIAFCKKDIVQYKPDVLILVDYPGFNLRIAEFAHKAGLKVIYYISPQVWAWKRSRVRKIRRVVDKMLVILPFEKEFYKKYNVDVEFVGHPLLDALAKEKLVTKEEFYKKYNLPDKPIVAILPGSRKQEVERMLNIMLEVIPEFDDYQFVVAGVGTITHRFYQEIIGDLPIKVLINKTHDIVHHATAALVTSGTATLETAMIGTPEVVCYRGNRISFAIAKRIVHVKFISLVNLIMDKLVVKELIQDDLNKKNLVSELNKILNDKSKIDRIRADYKELKLKLGQAGASDNAAKLIISNIENS